MKRVSLACLLIGYVAGGGLSAAADEAVETRLTQVFTDPTLPGLFQASIPWGAVRVRAHDGTDVEVRARITTAEPATAREARNRVPLELRERGNVIELRVLWSPQGFWGLDLEIDVPRATSLSLEIERGGDVFVDGVAGAVDVSNRNGSVTLENLGGPATVHARNGAIVADFAQVDSALPMSFSTMNGSVDVTFPARIAADVQVRYNRGGLHSDFPIESSSGERVEAEVEGLDGRATRYLQGRINGGGPRYRFETANGTIYIRRGS